MSLSNILHHMRPLHVGRSIALTLILALLAVAPSLANDGSLKGSGKKSDPYLIQNVDDWNTFAANVLNGNTYADEFIKLTADIGTEQSPVTTPIGNYQGKIFSGTFDGFDGNVMHTITVSISDKTQSGTAVFCFINGATIKNLIVKGTVSGDRHAAGLVGESSGTGNRIENCVVSATVSGFKYIGGILGHGLTSDISIDNCVFNGKLEGDEVVKGVFFGWGDNGGTRTVSNCLYIQQDGQKTKNLDLVKKVAANVVTVTDCYKTVDVGTEGTLVSLTPSDAIAKEMTAVDGTKFYMAATTEMTTGTYRVSDDVTIDERIVVAGDVTLILDEGKTLTASKGIEVSEGNSLTIDGKGALKAFGEENTAGIGGGEERSGGTITINGGTVIARGGSFGAGIGSGDCFTGRYDECGPGETITINGGTVTAMGRDGGAGIGGGYGGAVGTITINGGTITATGGDYGAGIGGGYGSDVGTITINGGKVTANGGIGAAGIGGYTNGLTTLGWTNGDDFIYASSYDGVETIKFADGKLFYCEVNDGITVVYGTSNIGGKTLRPLKQRLEFAIISGVNPNYIYTGNEINLTYKVTDFEGKELVEGTDYTASLNGTPVKNEFSVKDAGDYTLTITAKEDGVYKGSKIVIFTVAKQSLENATISGVKPNYLYTGNDIKLTYKVTDDEGKELVEGTDYTASLNGTPVKNEFSVKDAGGYTFTITAKEDGIYKGEKTISIIVSEGIPVTTATTTMTSGVYRVSSNVTINDRITISGDVLLILDEGKTLTASKGIEVSGDNSLTIDGKGALNAFGGDNGFAGIGGGDGVSGGTIIISGGKVTAIGGEYAAGIGGGDGKSGGTITISGGTVTATSRGFGAGIGGGYDGAGGSITISGGTVLATGGSVAAGIGGGVEGAGGTITISGGTVTATSCNGGAGIGGGQNGSGGTITISGGTVTATSREYGAGIGGGQNGSDGTITISGGSVTATCYRDGYGIGGMFLGLGVTLGWTNEDDFIYASSYGGVKTIKFADGKQFYYEENGKNEIVESTDNIGGKTLRPFDGNKNSLKYATISGVQPIYFSTGDDIVLTYKVTDVEGNELIEGKDYTASLNGSPVKDEFSVRDDGNYALIITAKENGIYTGMRTIRFSVLDYIPVTATTTTMTSGVYRVSSDVIVDSRITISGDVTLMLDEGKTITVLKGIQVLGGNSLTIDGKGMLVATGGKNTAGIGGDGNGSVGTITIMGGNVTAMGGYKGAGIGGGDGEAGGTIAIMGGTVAATGGIEAAGIGGGKGGAAGSIAIMGGKVTANGAAGIGSGADGGTNGSITLGWTNEDDFINASSYGNVSSFSFAKDKLFYYEENGVKKVAGLNVESLKGKTLYPKTLIIVTSSITEMTSGVYRVSSDVTVDSRITVTGDVKLILDEGTTFTASKGIDVSEGNSLTIEGKGTLNAFGEDYTAGIGGGDGSAGGTIVINGGIVSATGGDGAAGIGGGDGGAGGTVTINGGTVTTTGNYGAGIGGGDGGAGGTIAINGGIVTANGGRNAAGIGGGDGESGGTITISGGKVTANAGFDAVGIGSGKDGKISKSITLGWTSEDDFIKASSYGEASSFGFAEGRLFYYEENGVKKDAEPIVGDLEGKTLYPKVMIVTSSITELTSGTYWVSSNVTVGSRIKIVGDVKLILDEGCTLTASKGIEVSEGNSLTVDGKGSLKASGEERYAGIGSEEGVSCGAVTIIGGNVEANGGRDAAGIGGGRSGSGGTITVIGGIVTAAGGVKGAGIGGGRNGSCKQIVVSGGKVSAIAGKDASGFGPGNGGESSCPVTLGWTNEDDFIYADNYNNVSSLAFADNKQFYYTENGVNKVATIDNVAGKELHPFFGEHNLENATISGIEPSYTYTGNVISPAFNILDFNGGKVSEDNYVVSIKKDGIITPAFHIGEYTMVFTGKGDYVGTKEVKFSIVTNVIHDYAAVQVLQVKNGTRAVIDGEYSGTDAVAIDKGIEVDEVDFQRTFTPLVPGTVMLPFDLPASATVNAEFYVLTEVKQEGYSWRAVMTNIKKITGEKKALPQANTPYAVILHEGEDKLKFNLHGGKATLKTGDIQQQWNTDSTWFFTGTYGFKTWSENENKDEIGLVYAFSGSNKDGVTKGQFGRVASGATANPLRAYLRKKNATVTLKPVENNNASGASFVRAYSINLLPDVVNVEFDEMDDVDSSNSGRGIAGGERGKTGVGEKTTSVGRKNPAVQEIRMQPRTKQTYDLKGRRVNREKQNARGAYYGKKVSR